MGSIHGIHGSDTWNNGIEFQFLVKKKNVLSLKASRDSYTIDSRISMYYWAKM